MAPAEELQQKEPQPLSGGESRVGAPSPSPSPSSSTSPVCSVCHRRCYRAPRLIPINRLNLLRGFALAAVSFVSRRRFFVRMRTAAHLHWRTHVPSDERAAWHNVSNFHAKHASAAIPACHALFAQREAASERIGGSHGNAPPT